jgi:hypothetical protein
VVFEIAMNKGKINLKTIIVIVILLLVGVLGFLGVNTAKTFLSGAAAGADPKGVLATPGNDGKTATITWSTDTAVQSVVLYGASPAALLLSAPETDSSTDHAVALTSLRPGQNYYFRIEVGQETFDNGGIPWSFATSGSTAPTAAPVTPTVALVPTAVLAPGGCNHTTDYNHDGAINTMDYIFCVKNGTGSAPVPTGAVTGGGCNHTTDYNHDGVVNTVDYIFCMKSGGTSGPTPTTAK